MARHKKKSKASLRDCQAALAEQEQRLASLPGVVGVGVSSEGGPHVVLYVFREEAEQSGPRKLPRTLTVPGTSRSVPVKRVWTSQATATLL